MKANDFPVTIFVISSQLENEKFRTLLSDIINSFPDRITLGCHGYDHRSWSSFELNVEKFSAMLEKSNRVMTNFDSSRYRKWFEHLQDILLHGWQNLSKKQVLLLILRYQSFFFIMNYKYGKSNHKQALAAIDSSGLIEPLNVNAKWIAVCGPALFKFPFASIENLRGKMRVK